MPSARPPNSSGPPSAAAPAVLWLVRHGESLANLARNAAYAARTEHVDVADRDPDVPLSPLGRRQATALGRWFADCPEDERPTVVIASPYERARRTAERIVAAAADAGGAFEAPELLVDERWREKELGHFFRVTHHAIERRWPEEWALRQELDVFYYRPPGGESGSDVAFRVRAALADVAREHAGARVLVVCHQVTILCTRYVLERMSEAELLRAWRAYDLGNCSLTEYRPDASGRLALARLNFTAPVAEGGDAPDDGAPVTAEPPAAGQAAEAEGASA